MPANATPSPLSFCLSDESRNSYNVRVLTAGIETAVFGQNPIMLWMHERGMVIGRWENWRIEGVRLMADAVFDEEDPVSARIAGKVRRGFIKAVSVGLMILAAHVEIEDGVEMLVVTRSVLQEASIVDIPANDNCLILYSESGLRLTPDEVRTLKLHYGKPDGSVPPVPVSPTNQPMALETKTLAAAAGLPDTATDEQITQKVMQLNAQSTDQANWKTKYDDLQRQVTDQQTSRATALVDAAISDGRLPAEQKATYLTLFKADFATAETLLAGLKPTPATPTVAPGQLNLAGFVNGAAGGAAAGGSATADTTESLIAEYKRRDKDDSLLTLRADNPERFKQLYLARWGKPYAA